MKHVRFFLIFLAAICCWPGTAKAQTPRLEIHHIGAGDGDATLIIAIDTVHTPNLFGQLRLDTAIILIDGQRSSGGKEVWRYIRDTLNALSPALQRIDAVVISHLHIDHYGGIPRLIDSVYANGWNIGGVYDRQYANYASFDGGFAIIDSCYDSLRVQNPNAAAFLTYQQKLQHHGLDPTQTIAVGQDLLELAGHDLRYIDMFCEVAYGITSAAASDNDTCFLPVDNSSGINYYAPKSENDLSIGFLIRFQGFNYLTTGDLGGLSGGNYVDGETPLTKGLMRWMGNTPEYHMCANKVSHHGSRESTSLWFATTNRPTVSVIPASLRSYGTSAHALPTQTAITNLQSTGTNNLFYTFIPNNPLVASSYWTKGNLNLYNDVIIKLSGLPGFGQNITMTVIQAQKSKQFVYNGVTSVQTVTCTKGHPDEY